MSSFGLLFFYCLDPKIKSINHIDFEISLICLSFKRGSTDFCFIKDSTQVAAQNIPDSSVTLKDILTPAAAAAAAAGNRQQPEKPVVT